MHEDKAVEMLVLAVANAVRVWYCDSKVGVRVTVGVLDGVADTTVTVTPPLPPEEVLVGFGVLVAAPGGDVFVGVKVKVGVGRKLLVALGVRV